MAITLGLVEAIDSNGVYVTMPGSRGVLRGPYRMTGSATAGVTALIVETDDGQNVAVGAVSAAVGTYNVQSYGAVGDGVTDDTDAINAAVTACHADGGGVVLFPPGTYLTRRVGIRSNVRYVGYGATVKASQYWAFDARLYSGPHTNVVIEGFRIDAGDLATMGGVILYNSSNVEVRNCTIFNISGTDGSGVRLWHVTEQCRVVNNRIILPVDSPFGTMLNAAGVLALGEGDDAHGGGWNDTLTYTSPNSNYSRNHVISGNVITDGTHGVELIVATDCVVANNHINGPAARGVLMSPISSRNTITGNSISEFGSTGIHMSNGSCDNTVVGNNVWTTASIAWAEKDGIKAYYASNRNTVVGNTISGAGLRGVRMAMASTGFLIAGNYIRDCPTGISIEAYIDSTNTAYYQPNTPPDVTGWTIQGNHITDCPTGILLHQGNLTFGKGSGQYLKEGVICNNHVVGATDGVVFTENYTGKIADITAAGNLLRASGTDWDTPRGSAHFAADETPHP